MMFIHVCICVCTFVCIFVYAYVCVYVFVCVHTHTSSDYSVGVLVKGLYWCFKCFMMCFLYGNFNRQKFPISSILYWYFHNSKNFMHIFRTVFSNHKGTLTFASRFERWFFTSQNHHNYIILKKSMFGLTILVFVTSLAGQISSKFREIVNWSMLMPENLSFYGQLINMYKNYLESWDPFMWILLNLWFDYLYN